MTKRAKRGKEAAFARLESPETQPITPDGDVVGFEFDLKKTGMPAVVRFFCRAVGCPGYEHKASEIAHPFGTCGGIVNNIDAHTLEPAATDEPGALPPVIEPPPLTEPGHELPDVLASLPETGPCSGTLAPVLLEQNAAASHDMPALDDDQCEGAILPTKEIMSVQEIEQRVGWKPPEASTMAVEPKQEQPAEAALVTTVAPALPEPEPVAVPVEWQPPKAPDVPPAPPAGTILRRDDGLGDQPDFIEVLDSKTLRKVVVYVYPNVHLPTTYLFRDYTPYDFVGLVVVEELPNWALEIRQVLAGMPPLMAKQVPLPAAPEIPQKQAVEPLPTGQIEKAPVGSFWMWHHLADHGPTVSYIEVLDDGDPQACMDYEHHATHGERFVPQFHWPAEMSGTMQVESLPVWAERLRSEWLERDVVETPAVEQPVFARPPDEPMVAPEQPEIEPTLSDPVGAQDTQLAPFIPEIGTFWTCGEYLLEVVASDQDDSVQVVQYESGDGPVETSSWGTAETTYVGYTEFEPGKIEPAAFCPPPWVLHSRFARAFSKATEFTDRAVNEGNALDVAGAAVAAIGEATLQEPPPLPQFSASDGTTPHPLLSIAAVIHELATELDVKPLHVMRALETGLQTFGQLLTFREMATTSPAIESLVRLVSSNIARQGSFFAGFRAAISQATESMVDARINEFATNFGTRLSELERAARGVVSPTTAGGLAALADKAVITEILERAKNDCRELVSRAFDGWELKHQSPANPEDWSEIARDLDKAESRIFRLEGELKRVLDELKDYNRSVKLQKEDPQDSSQRGKAFREREKQKAREKSANLAALRKQKQAAEALERGKERKKKTPKKAPKSKWKQTTIQGSGLEDVPTRGSRPKPKKAVEGGGTVFATNLKAIDKFMGKAKDDKVRSLLGRLPPSQLPKFLAAASKGSIAVEITHWNGSELGAFAKWFYATTNKR